MVDTAMDGRLDRFGIRPRQLDGLDGIVFSPFLHGGFGHLIANSLPFLLMGGAICLGSTARFVQVTVVVGVIGGVGTWLTGPNHSVHIGASGLVFGYLTYLISRGVFARKVTYILGGIVTFMIYGGVLWGLLPAPGDLLAGASLRRHRRGGGRVADPRAAPGGRPCHLTTCRRAAKRSCASTWRRRTSTTTTR